MEIKIGFFWGLFIIFALLKIFNLIAWSWVVVFIPLMIWGFLTLILSIIALISLLRGY
jgi:hypothetical protein